MLIRFRLACLTLLLVVGSLPATDLTTWDHTFSSATVETNKATLTSEKWAFLRDKIEASDIALSADITHLTAAKNQRYFGVSWSVWPDWSVPDGGFDAGLLLRGGESSGYRIQLSHKYQEVTLVKYPDGGYLRSVRCEIPLNKKIKVIATCRGSQISVSVNDKEVLNCIDTMLILKKGRYGVGIANGAKATFENVSVTELLKKREIPAKHVPNFSTRKWLGNRLWVFDGAEPILLLPSAGETYLNNAKLQPGYRPMLSWNGHWDIANQGAFPDGTNKSTEPKVSGGGATLTATWSARQTKDGFRTDTTLVVGFDAKRGTYTYDVESELEVLDKQGFHFRYGYDFEHHTPLDPFRWQYLVVRRDNGVLSRRPVYPVDPGTMNDVEKTDGLRLWYGRHLEDMVVAPAVEYHLSAAERRPLHTAVCAAFYDTGVSLAAETAKVGSKVQVKYRYTGYPADEAKKLFEQSSVYPSPMLDPKHHYIFADEWPKLTFSQFVPMSETWIYGRTPFMTAHNSRPTYELAKGPNNNHAIKLGPASYARARLNKATTPLPKGQTLVTAQVKLDNVHGPGGRIELYVVDPKSGKVLREITHYLGNGSHDWKKITFATDVLSEAPALELGLGNAGTGDVYVTDLEFAASDKNADPPASTPAKIDAAPTGAIADYRFGEGKGLFVYDYARGPFGLLELANLDWTKDEGRAALKFADNTTGRKEYPRSRSLDRGYFSHASYQDKLTTPVASAGFHGGGFELKAFTISTWVKPGESMPDGRGDVVGLGARRFIVSLTGKKAPYTLSAYFNVNDAFHSPAKLDANKWHHIALTAEPTAEKKWRARLYLDGKLMHEATTVKMDAPTTIPPSLVLGTELFYFHSSYYRGLIGKTLVFDKTLTAQEIAELANELPRK